MEHAYAKPLAGAVLIFLFFSRIYGEVSGIKEAAADVFGAESCSVLTGVVEGTVDNHTVGIRAYVTSLDAGEVIGCLARKAVKNGEKPVNSFFIRGTAAKLLALTCGEWVGRWYYFASVDNNNRMILSAAGNYARNNYFIRVVFEKKGGESLKKKEYDFRQYPGAVENHELSVKNGWKNDYSAAIFSVDGVEMLRVFSFYKESLRTSGWKIKETGNESGGAIFFAEKDKKIISIGVSRGGTGAVIITIAG